MLRYFFSKTILTIVLTNRLYHLWLYMVSMIHLMRVKELCHPWHNIFAALLQSPGFVMNMRNFYSTWILRWLTPMALLYRSQWYQLRLLREKLASTILPQSFEYENVSTFSHTLLKRRCGSIMHCTMVAKNYAFVRAYGHGIVIVVQKWLNWPKAGKSFLN